jgi:hypothetical protein
MIDQMAKHWSIVSDKNVMVCTGNKNEDRIAGFMH